MDLKDALIYKGIFGGSSGGGGGSVVLKRSGRDDAMIPAGLLGPSAYYRLWKDTPTISQMIGGVIGSTFPNQVLTEMKEDYFVDISETDGVPIIAYMNNQGDEGIFAVIAREFTVEGFVFEPGIYFIEGLISDYTLCVLTYTA